MHDKDTFGAQGPVHNAVVVGVPNGVRHLAHEVQAYVERKRTPALAEIVIEANFVRFSTEQNGRTELMLGEVQRTKNAWMIQ